MANSFEFRTKLMLLGSEFINGIRRDLTSALLIIYFISLGHDVLAVTSVFAVSRILFLVFEFPTGAFADHYSRKKSVLISFTLMSIAFFGIFLFKNFWLLAAGFILHDIAWTFQSGTTTAWAVDNLKLGKKKNALASLFARLHFFERFGSIIGGIIGLVIVGISFRFIWLFIAIVNLAWMIVLWIATEEKNFKPRKEGHFIIKTFVQAKESIAFLFHKKNRRLQGFATAMFIGTTGMDTFFVLIPLIFVQILGLTADKVPLIFSLVALLAIWSPFLGEKTIHKFGFRRPLFFGYVCAGVAIVVFAISHSLWLSIISLAFMHIMETAYTCVGYDAALQHMIPSKSRASLGSAMSIVWAIGSSLAALLAGIGIKTIGLVNTGIAAGAIVIVSGFWYKISMKKK